MPSSDNSDKLDVFKIFSAGTQVGEQYGIASVVIYKSVNRVPSARIIVNDGSVSKQTFEVSETDLFKPGTEIEIRARQGSEESSLFKGIVIKNTIKSKPNKSSQLVVDIKDKSVKMTVGRKSKYYKDTKDSDLIEDLLDTYGLQKDVTATKVEHKEMVQYYTTDWDFMLSRAEVNAMLVFSDDGKVTIKEPDLSAEAIELTFGSNIIEVEAGIDARDQLAAVKSKAWDYSSQELTEEDGDEPKLEEAGNIASSELSDVIGLKEWPQVHTGKIVNEELKAWADARLLRSRLAKIRGRVKIVGKGDVKPGSVVQLAGIGDRFKGKCFVSGIVHHVSASTNWYTDIELGFSSEWFSSRYEDIEDPPAGGLVPGIQGLQNAVVTKIDSDPDGEDRIQVKMPVVSTEDEGVWARVATLDAGNKRGSFFRPDVDDEVVVGFLNNDPRYPVVLGMMNSSAKPAPITADSENKEKGFVTRSELKLIFNDDKKSIIIETPNGNKITFTDEDDSIKMTDKTGNKVELTTDGINIESPKNITIKATGDVTIEGKNVSNKANAQFKAEGTAGLEVTSSATAKIQGALVQIN